MSVNQGIEEQEGQLSVLLYPSTHIFVLLCHTGKCWLPVTTSSSLKEALPAVQECMSPVESYLFGPILLGA